MIPNINILTETITENTYANRTYKINENRSRINGYTDELDAVVQAVSLILNTERYEFPIYSFDYGVELLDLYGKPIPYVMSELPRRVREALLTDNRILEVSNFEFERKGSKLHMSFDVESEYGTIQSAMTLGNSPETYASDSTELTLNTVGILTFNVPAFNNEGVLMTNEIPYLNADGVLIYE